MRLFLLLLFTACTKAEIYIYSTKYTVTTGISGLPNFMASSFIHGKQIDYYNSHQHKLYSRQTWTKEELGDSYWEKTTQLRRSESRLAQTELWSAMESFGHSEGMHTLQRRYGCLWEQDTGYTKGFDTYGYDGKNFLYLDLKNRTYISWVPQARFMAEEWSHNRTRIDTFHYYFQDCVDWLKSLFPYEDSEDESWRYKEITTNVIPTITQYLKTTIDSSLLLACHATGLSSDQVRMSWKKNKKDADNYVEVQETLPNGDGSYQKTIYLLVKVDEFINNKYICSFEYMSVAGKRIIEITKETTFNWENVRSHSRWGNYNNYEEEEDDEEEDEEEED